MWQGFRSVTHNHPIDKGVFLTIQFHEPLILVLVYTNRAILVDSILSGTSLPTPSLKGASIVLMDFDNIGAVKKNTNRSTW
jgi:hypothetical protein